jgi:hypothetical protein
VLYFVPLFAVVCLQYFVVRGYVMLCIRIAMSLCDLRMCHCSGVCVLLCIVYYFSPFPA